MPTTARPPARERLLQAAETVLFERGIRATPVDELLRHAEVSVATLYAQFGSKDALVAEALQRRLANWRAVWDEQVIAADDDLGRLLALFDALSLYRDGRRPRARWCAFLATAAEHPEAPAEIEEVLAADTALLRQRLEHLAAPLAGERAPQLADEILLIYNGTLAAFLRGRPTDPIDVGRRLAQRAAGGYSLR